MIPVCSVAEVRELDRRAIEGLGVPGAALMETAGRALAEHVHRRWAAHAGAPVGSRVVVAAGAGNNGGDGWVAARWLHGWGVPVVVWPCLGPTAASSPDAALHRLAAERAGVEVVEGEPLAGAVLIVDAVFGTGLTRPIAGAAADVIAAIEDHPAPVIAADLPSGVCGDTGAVLGVAPTCLATVTFGRHKRGLWAGAGRALAGEVEVADLGFDAVGLLAGAALPDAAELSRCVPSRRADAHKGRSGHLVLVAGSAAMAGAAVLVAKGALAAGAGLITLVAPRGAWPRLAHLPPEVMCALGGEGDTLDGAAVLAWRGRATAWAVGPGLGGGAPLDPGLAAALATLWAEERAPAVWDADALVAVSGATPGGPRVLTPHPGEAARLLGVDAAEVEADRFGAVARLVSAAALPVGSAALLKGPGTLVASPGLPTSVNPTGGPTLATGGAGDVLTGVIGALLARGASPRDAARLGAWMHGDAADALAARRREGWGASDVAAAIPDAWQRLVEAS